MTNISVASGRDHTNEIRRLSTLLEVSQALSGVLNLKAALQSVLDLLERRHQVVGGTVFLQDPDSRELHAEASVGTRLAGQRARRGPGDGITERVIDTGKPVVVPRVSQEPALAPPPGERAKGGRELTYLAVPIPVGRRPGGTLEVVLTFKQDRDYQRSLEFYRVVASMIAQALKLRRTVEADRSRLAEENEHLRDELRDKYAFRSIIGNSASIQQVYEQVAQVARTNTTVLIRGESGTGKEMIAHAIHYNSPRAKKPFIKVSCAALPESLIESELFGYEKGAFTGAQGAKKGRFELAEGGTIFLDEIGDVSLSTQVKLLRVLQEREIERLGGTSSIRINVRLIAATHRPLEELMEEGKFRADLFYRLAVFTIFAPPLRERKPDIMLLADHFLEKVLARARQRHPARLDAGHRHADQLSLAGQRPRAREHDRARGPRLRWRRRSRASPPAHAPDGRGVRYRGAPVARRERRSVRARSAAGCLEDQPRQLRQGRPAAVHDRADLQLQEPQVRNRRQAVQELTVAGAATVAPGTAVP